MTQNIRIVKREIRILGLDACRTNTVFGAVVRGGLYLDGVLRIPIISNPDNRKIARAIRESRYFPELRAIMIHDPNKRLRLLRLEKLTGLPVLQVLRSQASGWKAHHTGRGTLWIRTRLPDQTAEKILSITWAFGKLPEPIRIAHLFAKTRSPKMRSERKRLNSPHQRRPGAEHILQFCPKCGTTLLPQKKEKKVFLGCMKCGYTSTKGEKVISRLSQEKEKIVVIGREEQKIRTLPKVKAECPKCNNHEAFYWLVQTRGGDESSTQFFRCTSCGATWRENS